MVRSERRKANALMRRREMINAAGKGRGSDCANTENSILHLTNIGSLSGESIADFDDNILCGDEKMNTI